LVYHRLKREFASLSLDINQNKCQLFYDSNKTPVIPDNFAGIQPSTTFIKILVTPIGADGEVIDDTALTIDNNVNNSR
jgi:hypothetical protein